MLFGVKPSLSARIVFDYFVATLKTMFSTPKQEDSFEEWGVRNLGRHAVRPVLRDLLRARLGAADVADFVEAGAARRQAESQEHHPAHARHQGGSAAHFTEYMYPRAGISDLYENMAARFRDCGGELLLECAGRVPASGTATGSSRVTYRQNGSESTVPCRGVRVDAAAADARQDDHAGAAGIGARARRGVCDIAASSSSTSLLNREQLTDFHWVYLLDKDFRINRVSEQKNVSPYMVPKGQTVLCIEVSLLEGRADLVRVRRGVVRDCVSRSAEDRATASSDQKSRSITSSASKPRIRCTS